MHKLNIPQLGKLVRVLTYLLLSLLLSVALLLVITLGSRTGRVLLLQWGIKTLESHSEFRIEQAHLRSPSLTTWQVSDWQVTKNQQVLARAQQLKLVWQPQKLWQGQLVVSTLSIDNLELDPALWQSSAAPQVEREKAFSLADFLAQEWPQIEIQQLELRPLKIKNLLIGSHSEPLPPLHIKGSLQTLKGQKEQILLSAKSANQPSFTVEIKLTGQRPESIAISAKVQETGNSAGSSTSPSGGSSYLSTLLRLPNNQGIDIGLEAELSADAQGYQFKLEKFQAPIAKHQVSASGLVATTLNFSEGKTSELKLLVDQQVHHLSAEWNPKEIRAAAKLQRLPIAISEPWQQQLEGGYVSADIKFSGTLQAPRAEGQMELTSRYQDSPLELKLSGKAGSQSADIQQLNGRWGQSRIQGKGPIHWQQGRSDFKAKVENIDFSILQQFDINLPQPLQGQAEQIDVHLQGRIQDLEGEASAVFSGTYAEEAFSFNGDLNKQADTVNIDHSSLEVAGGNARAYGQLNIKNLQGNLQLEAEALPFSLLKLGGVSLPEQLQGTLEAQGVVSGDLRKPAVEGQALLKGRYQNVPFDLQTKGGFKEQNLTIEKLKLLAFDKPALNVKGHVALNARSSAPSSTDNNHNAAQTMDVQISAKRLPTELLEALGWKITSGKFNADLHLNGPVFTPNIQGSLNFHRNGSEHQASNDEEQQSIAFGWNLGIDTVDDHYLAIAQVINSDLPSGQLQIKTPRQTYRQYFQQLSSATPEAATPKATETIEKTEPAFPLQASLAGQLNLFALSTFIDPELHSFSGILESKAILSGTLKQPNIQGELSLQDVNYANPSNGSKVQNIHCSISMQQSTFTLKTCQATDGAHGSIQLEGKVRLPEQYIASSVSKQSPPLEDKLATSTPKANAAASETKPQADQGIISLSAKADKIQLLQRPDIESEASGELQLQGDFKSLLASGEIEVAPLTALIDATTSSNIPSIKVTRIENSAQFSNRDSTNNYSLPELNLNLVVSAGQHAFIRGHGLEAELSGKIILRGTAQKPRYDGEFKTLRGTFEVFGKKFKLEQGLVNFSNNAIALNITGKYEKQGREIKAELSGTGEKPELSLTSVPDMAEDEILAFIIFGKSIHEITPFEALQLASSAQTLRGDGSFFDPIGSARNLLGVDTLSIGTETDDEGETNVSVGIGKYLNDKVYLELERSPNPSQPWKGNLQIELSPNIHLESASGETSGIDGAEIKWKRDY